jgi:hypothetical protein
VTSPRLLVAHDARDPASLALGGSHLDVGQRPEERHVVLADPDGNEFCLVRG